MRSIGNQPPHVSENYVGGPLSAAQPYAFPGDGWDLQGLPPTYIENCEFDELRASGERFAAQLEAAGVPVECRTACGVGHGHLSIVGSPYARATLERLSQRLTQPHHWSRQMTEGRENQRRADLGDGTFLNPVIAGDHPDPTVLRDGDDYYLTYSSFDDAPGLVIWHSRDLVNWQPVGPAVPDPPGCVFASDLVKVDGRYYLYIPFMPAPWSSLTAPSIMAVWADDIRGPWSAPVDLGIRGYIDPGHVVGEDGRRYLFLNGVERVRLTDDGLGTDGPIEHAYDGWRYPEDWVVEAYSLEGPKLFRRGEWFYLVSAVGGTAGPATGHMVTVARSRSVLGPWEDAPHNPLIRCTDAAQAWWSRGHATLVEGPGGQWYAVHHGYENGFPTLGRQVLLEPIEWVDDWPYARGGDLSQPLPMPLVTGDPHGLALSDGFEAPAWGTRWSFDHPDRDESSRATFDDGLVLSGKGTSPGSSSPLTVRAGDRSYVVEVELERLDETVAGGLLLFFNPRLYMGLGLDETGLTTYSGGRPTWGREPVPTGVRTLGVRIENAEHIVTMWYRVEDGDWVQHSTRFETSGYHANTMGDLQQLRPALFASGDGSVRFRSFRYRAGRA